MTSSLKKTQGHKIQRECTAKKKTKKTKNQVSPFPISQLSFWPTLPPKNGVFAILQSEVKRTFICAVCPACLGPAELNSCDWHSKDRSATSKNMHFRVNALWNLSLNPQSGAPQPCLICALYVFVAILMASEHFNTLLIELLYVLTLEKPLALSFEAHHCRSKLRTNFRGPFLGYFPTELCKTPRKDWNIGQRK